MKKVLIIVFTLFFISTAFAQKNDADSLLQLLNTYPKEDSVRLNLFTNLSYAYFELQPEDGVVYADKAIVLAKKLQMPAKLADAYYYKGMCMGTKGIYNDALDLYNNAIKIYNALHAEQKIWKVNNSIAIIYMNLSEHEKALEIYLKNMTAAEQMKDENKIALTAGNISIFYVRIDKPNNALQFNQRAIEINKRIKDNNALANAYAARGNIYDEMNRFPDAIGSYREGLSISEPANYQIGIANNAGNMGSVYGEMEKYDSAFYFIKKGLEIYSTLGFKRNTAVLYGYLGDIILASPDSALLKENILPGKKYSTALTYYNTAMNLHKETGSTLDAAESWEQISKLYKVQKNYEEAYNAYVNYSLLKDSSLNKDESKAIEKLSSQYEFQKKTDSIKEANDKKMIIVSAEIKREKAINNAMLFGGIILVSSALIIFIFYKRNRDITGQKVAAEFDAKVADTEMKALRSQMNPHFIFNSLNSVSDYISKNDTQSANIYLTRFAKVMRMILENSEQKEVTLADDLKALELYMQLESLRLINKFSYEIKVDDNIDTENTMVPPLILQPFVENSIWHGIAKKEGSGHILINIKKEGEMINCIVEDNGTGRINNVDEQPANANKKSLGMKITKSRIDIINKLKNSNAAVTISDLSEGTRAEVKLPLELGF